MAVLCVPKGRPAQMTPVSPMTVTKTHASLGRFASVVAAQTTHVMVSNVRPIKAVSSPMGWLSVLATGKTPQVLAVPVAKVAKAAKAAVVVKLAPQAKAAQVAKPVLAVPVAQVAKLVLRVKRAVPVKAVLEAVEAWSSTRPMPMIQARQPVVPVTSTTIRMHLWVGWDS